MPVAEVDRQRAHPIARLSELPTISSDGEAIMDTLQDVLSGIAVMIFLIGAGFWLSVLA